MKTGLFTAAWRRPSTMRPGCRTPEPRMTRLRGVASSDAATQTRPRARATARASDVLPIPPGPARHRTDARGPAGAGRATSAGHGSVPRTGAGTGPLEGQQVARLGARREEPEDGLLHAVEDGVAAVENPGNVIPVEPLRLADRPRQVEHQLDPADLGLGSVSAGLERAGEALRELPRGRRPAGRRRRGRSRTARVDTGPPRESRSRRTAVEDNSPWKGRAANLPGAGPGRTVREQPGRGLRPAGRLLEQLERPRLVHDDAPAGDRQVGQIPQMALLRRGHHVRRPRPGGTPRARGRPRPLPARDRRECGVPGGTRRPWTDTPTGPWCPQSPAGASCA